MSVIDSEFGLISVILGSSVVAAFITSFFIKLGEDKKIRIENITQERKEWRDRIRELTVELTHAFDSQNRAKLRKIEAEFIVRLNPEDPEDLNILKTISQLYDNNCVWREDKLVELCDRLAYLLKHDWERVKREVSGSLSLYDLLFSVVSIVLFVCFFKLFIQIKLLGIIGAFISVGVWFLVSVFLYKILKACAQFFIQKKCKGRTLVKGFIGLVERLPYRDRANRKTSGISVFCFSCGCSVIVFILITTFVLMSGFSMCN